jgi:hypothetical protein
MSVESLPHEYALAALALLVPVNPKSTSFDEFTAIEP